MRLQKNTIIEQMQFLIMRASVINHINQRNILYCEKQFPIRIVQFVEHIFKLIQYLFVFFLHEKLLHLFIGFFDKFLNQIDKILNIIVVRMRRLHIFVIIVQ